MSAANDNQADDFFGLCPGCYGPAAPDRGDRQLAFGYRNFRSDHWFTCDVHMTRWSPGSNLFSDWRDETEADWSRNARDLGRYRKVEPFHWPETLAAGAAAPGASDSPGNPFDGFAA